MPLDLVAYRLHNQYLSQSKFTQAADLVRCLGAVQAQDFAGAKWAISLRSSGLTDAEIERAFTDGVILRTHVLRPTWHFVAPEDIRWMLALTAPRVRAQMAFMDRQLELDPAIFKKSNAALHKILQGGKQMTRAELEPAFQKAGIPAQGQRLGHLLMHAELEGIVCSGPRKGKQFTYALLEERVPAARALTREESLAELLTRYITTRGPATLQDFSWWSGLTLTDARAGMEMVKPQFLSETIDQQTYWFAETQSAPRKNSYPAYLLPNYDEFFIAYKDRRAIGQVAEQTGIQKDDPALLSNVILLNGQIAGGWKRTLAKDKVQVEASLLHPLSSTEKQALAQAADRFGEFLELPTLFIHKEYSRGQRTSRSF